MSKEMNKLRNIITKYNMLYGLFMSLIIGLIFNWQIAVIFLLGVIVGTFGYISRVLVVQKWIGKGKFTILTTTIIRIFVTVAFVVPIIYDLRLVVAYLTGFTIHLLVEGYCTKM